MKAYNSSVYSATTIGISWISSARRFWSFSVRAPAGLWMEIYYWSQNCASLTRCAWQSQLLSNRDFNYNLSCSPSCTYNIYGITPIYSIHESPRCRSLQVELGKVEGFFSVLQLLQQALAKYLNVEQQAHWLLIQKRTNQLHHVMSLCQIELDLSDCAI